MEVRSAAPCAAGTADFVQALESQRLKRMSGDYDSDDEAMQSAAPRSKLALHSRQAGGDDLTENYAIEDIDDDEEVEAQDQEDSSAILQKIAAKWKRDLHGDDASNIDEEEGDDDDEADDDEEGDDEDGGEEEQEEGEEEEELEEGEEEAADEDEVRSLQHRSNGSTISPELLCVTRSFKRSLM
jgi:segregation and condensation protein B